MWIFEGDGKIARKPLEGGRENQNLPQRPNGVDPKKILFRWDENINAITK